MNILAYLPHDLVQSVVEKHFGIDWEALGTNAVRLSSAPGGDVRVVTEEGEDFWVTNPLLTELLTHNKGKPLTLNRHDAPPPPPFTLDDDTANSATRRTAEILATEQVGEVAVSLLRHENFYTGDGHEVVVTRYTLVTTERDGTRAQLTLPYQDTARAWRAYTAHIAKIAGEEQG
jgi:hypothetical protein